MCSLLHRGHRLGERTVSLLVKVNPHDKHFEGFIPKVPLRDLRMCSRWIYTSFSGMWVAWEISFAVHSPEHNNAIMFFLIVMGEVLDNELSW